MIPTFVCIPFRGLHGMTKHLLQQLWKQDEYAFIWCYNNGPHQDWIPELAQPESAVYGWKTRIGRDTQVIEAHNWRLHRMFNDAYWLAEPCDPGPFNMLFLNNDIILSPHFISRLSAVLRAPENDDLIVLSANQDHLPGTGVRREPRGDEAPLYGPVMMFKGELCGEWIFDEEYRFWYGDSLAAIYANLAGYSAGIALDVHYTHVGGGSLTTKDVADEVDYWNAIKQDEKHFAEQWPMIPPGRKWL